MPAERPGLFLTEHIGDELGCLLRTEKKHLLTLRGNFRDAEPSTEGYDRLAENPAVVHNAWAFAKHERMHRRLVGDEERSSHKDQAEAHKKIALFIADVVDRGLSGSARGGWCSACFILTGHLRVSASDGRFALYLCSGCGSPTQECAAINCRNFASRGTGPVRLPRYCAEHRHEIPGFEKATKPLNDLTDYEDFLTFEKRNLVRGSQVAMGALLSAGIIATGGMLAAPAIGGAIGVIGTGLSGAAASSYGLALLGGGSLAAGGLGMAGGTAVVAGAGGALGGALGASITTAYVGADKSFRIEQLRDGEGTPVVVANGFLTEGSDTTADWESLIKSRYPRAPLYRVHWGSKELIALGLLVGNGLGNVGLVQAVKVFAAKASKSAAGKLGPAGAVLAGAMAIKNPWHTAKVRADKTGVVLADLLARTEVDRYILIGHSLGARAMATAAQTLATKNDAPRVESVHLLGAALGAKGDWLHLNNSVSDRVYNYHSKNDKVLGYLYFVAQGGKKAAGLHGFDSEYRGIEDVDVSELVNSHSDYICKVDLR